MSVTGHGDAQGYETSRLPHFLHNRLTYGGEAVSLPRQPPFTPGRFLVLISVKMLSRPQGHSAAGRFTSTEKSNDIANRTRDLPVCSIVPQPTALPRTPSRCRYTSRKGKVLVL
jgi:hypothetical protein